MGFKKGDPKPPTSGIKKGQKHQRTMAEEACAKLKINPFEMLAQLCLQGSETAIIQLCKHIEPPKKPIEVAIDPEQSIIRIIVEDFKAK